MNLKVGDKVIVIAGSNKGKEGTIKKVLKRENRVIVEGVHVVKKHLKPGRMNETGGIITKEAPINASNVKVIDDKTAAAAKKEEKKEAKAKTAEAKKAAKKPAKKTTKKESDK